MRREKHALIKKLIPVRIGPDFRADRRRRHAARNFSTYSRLPTIYPPVGAMPPRDFYSANRPQCPRRLCRLRLFHKLAVAIVNENTSPESAGTNKFTDLCDLCLTERVAPGIPRERCKNTTLTEGSRSPSRMASQSKEPSSFNSHFLKRHAVIGKRAVPFPRDDPFAERIIRIAGKSKTACHPYAADRTARRSVRASPIRDWETLNPPPHRKCRKQRTERVPPSSPYPYP